MKVMFYILWYAPGMGGRYRTIYWRRCAFVLSKRIKRAKVSRRLRSCWVYIGAVYHAGLQNGDEMDSRLLRNARRQAGRPYWIASDTAKRF